jgi:hypothetical protein
VVFQQVGEPDEVVSLTSFENLLGGEEESVSVCVRV